MKIIKKTRNFFSLFAFYSFTILALLDFHAYCFSLLSYAFASRCLLLPFNFAFLVYFGSFLSFLFCFCFYVDLACLFSFPLYFEFFSFNFLFINCTNLIFFFSFPAHFISNFQIHNLTKN